MAERLFGTDGIRGLANIHPMTAEMALQVGRVAGHFFKRDDRQHTILIGKDTRRSCYMIENALTAGLCSVGMRVLLTGPLPTPGVSYIMRSLRCDGAIMISASHNSYADNGIKIFGADGYKIPDAVEDEIARVISTGEIDHLRPTGEKIGTAFRIDDAVGRYIEFTKASFPKGMRLDGLRIVVDCANGAAYKSGPSTFSELGAEVIPIGVRPDGLNINGGFGTVHPEEMRATVIREKANVGVAFDGDGDRIAMADENGRLLNGNAVLCMLGLDMIGRGLLPGNAVVTTVMANGGLERALAGVGGGVVRTNVGDRYVVEAMLKEGLVLGGEPSGHVTLLDYNTTGDAMIAALQVLAAMIRRDQPLSALAHVYQEMPECHGRVPLANGQRPGGDVLEALAADVQARMEGRGRVVIRPSGTEPLIRIMVQHEKMRTAEETVAALTARVAEIAGT